MKLMAKRKDEPIDREAERRKPDVRGATPERLARAGTDYEVGDDQQGTRIYVLRDSPLERMFKRKAIDPIEYTALQRFKHHWYHSGLIPSMGSVDLNRIFASDPSNSSGMARSEAQAHHRKQWREACEKINPRVPEWPEIEMLGHRRLIVVDNVACFENSLEVAGYAIGYKSKFRAIEAASAILRKSGYDLARLWGIG